MVSLPENNRRHAWQYKRVKRPDHGVICARSHDSLSKATLSVDPESGTTHRRHHIAADGFYRGREIIPPKPVDDEEEDETN